LLNAYAGRDTLVCDSDSITLQAGLSRGMGTWSIELGSGNIKDLHQPNTTIKNLPLGRTVLRWTKSQTSCSATDLVTINRFSSKIPSRGFDTTLCVGESIILQPESASNYIWSNGDTTPTINVNTENRYSVILNRNTCAAHDTFQIKYRPRPSSEALPVQLVCPTAELKIGRPAQRRLIYRWDGRRYLSNDSIAQPLFKFNQASDSLTTVALIRTAFDSIVGRRCSGSRIYSTRS
jgi:hypothetical protein